MIEVAVERQTFLLHVSDREAAEVAGNELLAFGEVSGWLVPGGIKGGGIVENETPDNDETPLDEDGEVVVDIPKVEVPVSKGNPVRVPKPLCVNAPLPVESEEALEDVAVVGSGNRLTLVAVGIENGGRLKSGGRPKAGGGTVIQLGGIDMGEYCSKWDIDFEVPARVVNTVVSVFKVNVLVTIGG